MPAKTDYQGTPSHSHSHNPFSSFGRSLLSLRRDAPASTPLAMPLPGSGDATELDAFQRQLAALLADLLRFDGDEEFLSAKWVQRLLQTFLACQDEFRAAVSRARHRGGAAIAAQAERVVNEFGERAVKALDVCNAARDGVDQVRRWERLAALAASVLVSDGEVHEGQLRRARKALADLSALLADANPAGTTASSSSSVLGSHRNRSFGSRATPSRASPSRSTTTHSPSSSSNHFRSLSWSVSRTWSAARQLQSITAGMSSSTPRAHESGVVAAAHALGSLLHLAAWALVAAVPCPDRAAALQAHHHHMPLQPPRAAFAWAAPLVAVQERLAEEGKRKDRRNSPGLLKEIHALERAAQRLAEEIDAALNGDHREVEVREVAAELAAACDALRSGVEPMERQVREVFHRIVRSRMEGLDSPVMINGGD